MTSFGHEPAPDSDDDGSEGSSQLVFDEELSSLQEGCVVVTLLKICHYNVQVCYGCKTRFTDAGIGPDDLVFVSRLKRRWKGRRRGEVRIANEASNVYFIIHPDNPFGCLSYALQQSGFQCTSSGLKFMVRLWNISIDGKGTN